MKLTLSFQLSSLSGLAVLTEQLKSLQLETQFCPLVPSLHLAHVGTLALSHILGNCCINCSLSL